MRQKPKIRLMTLKTEKSLVFSGRKIAIFLKNPPKKTFKPAPRARNLELCTLFLIKNVLNIF